VKVQLQGGCDIFPNRKIQYMTEHKIRKAKHQIKTQPSPQQGRVTLARLHVSQTKYSKGQQQPDFKVSCIEEYRYFVTCIRIF